MAAGPKADGMGGGGWEKDGPCRLVLQPESSPRPTWGDQGSEQHVYHLSFHSAWYTGSVHKDVVCPPTPAVNLSIVCPQHRAILECVLGVLESLCSVLKRAFLVPSLPVTHRPCPAGKILALSTCCLEFLL